MCRFHSTKKYKFCVRKHCILTLSIFLINSSNHLFNWTFFNAFFIFLGPWLLPKTVEKCTKIKPEEAKTTGQKRFFDKMIDVICKFIQILLSQTSDALLLLFTVVNFQIFDWTQLSSGLCLFALFVMINVINKHIFLYLKKHS